MDMSFAVQAMTLEHLHGVGPLEPDVYPVPREIDDRIARMKLETLGVQIDRLTEDQLDYLGRERS
jgi:adenosylhomocysteinase